MRLAISAGSRSSWYRKIIAMRGDSGSVAISLRNMPPSIGSPGAGLTESSATSSSATCGRRCRLRRPQVALDDVAEISVRPAEPDLLLGGMLRRLIASLPESPRMAMVLRYQEDMDPGEIAETMGIPLGTVKSHIQRSLALLREKLERRGVGER